MGKVAKGFFLPAKDEFNGQIYLMEQVKSLALEAIQPHQRIDGQANVVIIIEVIEL